MMGSYQYNVDAYAFDKYYYHKHNFVLIYMRYEKYDYFKSYIGLSGKHRLGA